MHLFVLFQVNYNLCSLIFIFCTPRLCHAKSVAAVALRALTVVTQRIRHKDSFVALQLYAQYHVRNAEGTSQLLCMGLQARFEEILRRGPLVD